MRRLVNRRLAWRRRILWRIPTWRRRSLWLLLQGSHLHLQLRIGNSQSVNSLLQSAGSAHQLL